MEKIIQQYHNRVFAFLLKYVKIPEVAEDLTQDVMIKLWQNRNKIESLDDQEAYILAITRNYIRDHFKKMSREKIYMEEVIQHLPVQDNSLHQTIQRHDLQNSIRKVVAELPERQRQVYQLVYDHGKSLKETAKELDISPYTAKNHRAQALKVIRARINPEAFLTGLIMVLSLVFPGLTS